MSSKHFIAELAFEITSTTKLLERIPEEKFTWKPREKAMSLGVLAFHVASIPGNYSSFAEEGKTKLAVLVYHHTPGSKKEILERFAVSIAKVKQVSEKGTDEWDSLIWELIKDGKSIFQYHAV